MTPNDFAARYLFASWLDTPLLAGVVRVYLPLSRLWATALDADESEHVAHALPMLAAGPQLTWAYRRLHFRAETYGAAEAEWRAAFFDGAPRDLRLTFRRREAAARDFIAARFAFMSVPGWWRVPAMRFDIPDLSTVESAHGPRLASPMPFAPAAGAVDKSAALERNGLRTYWLRYPSPAGDTAWARVVEPLDATDCPSHVTLHGLGVENEMFGHTPDPYRRLVERGIRVIHAEAPHHGRRRTMGWAGGEPILGRAPLGMLDLLKTWSAEAGRLIAWARSQGSRRVGLGGISLGALTAQQVASHADGWPAESRPDLVLLVTTSGDMLDVSLDGSLARGLGVGTAMAQKGWNAAALERWRPLLEPAQRPGIDPASILFVLGETDDVTPFRGGQALAERWRIPPGNRLLRPRGHFSQALAMTVEHELMDRLAQDLTGRPTANVT